MGQKINPTAFRLAIKQPWWSVNSDHFSNVASIQHLFIRKLITGCFKALNYFVSPIGIFENSRGFIIILLVYNNSKDKLNKDRLIYIKELIKNILKKKFNINVTFVIRETTLLTSNAQILGDWLANVIAQQPNLFKSYIKLIMRTGKGKGKR